MSLIVMDAVFKALADRNRRKMLDRLFAEPGLSLSELIVELEMTRQSASRHVSVLIDAELVIVHWDGREKLHYLNAVPLVEASDRWLGKFAKQNTRAVLALKKALEDKKSE